MTDIDKTVNDTAQYEGYKPGAYKDTRGLWTVGEGTCLETNPISGKDWKSLLDAGLITVSVTGAGARWLMRSKIAAELRDLATRYHGFAALPDLAQTLLLEMSYQMGVDGVLAFTDFNNLIRSGQFAAAAADGRKTRWYSQTPARAELILKQLEGIKT
jgi:lysozyme